MTNPIEAILFDVGGTLRRTVKREPGERKARLRRILEILGSDVDPGVFMEQLDERLAAYERWSDEILVAVDEAELWSRWLLPEWPADRIRQHALTFHRIWRESIGVRPLLPEAVEIILHLFRSGYRLGVVSNTLSSEETPAALENAALAGCFEVVILSCQVGLRKPDPAMLLHATQRMGVDPARCAYVGNNPERDVVSARKAGFGSIVIINNPKKPVISPEDPALKPDHRINDLLELKSLFLPIETDHHLPVLKANRIPQKNGSPLYAASLSTMWGVKKFHNLDDFFIAAGRMGFSYIELNHQITSDMLSGSDIKNYALSSIHEPCPADIPTDTLKKRDWMISSLDEECRRQGVEAIQKSIDLANELEVKTLVVHSGQVDLDGAREGKLRGLYRDGQFGSPLFDEIKAELVAFRARDAEAHLDASMRSLKELLEYAGRSGIRLGLENRYHYLDIPTQDEMACLLELAEPDRLGFIYDSGHGRAMDLLGFFDDETWLERFGMRIFGVHLQDAIGLEDHYAPGRGEIDFRRIAPYLPKEAFRTCEVLRSNSAEQVRNALKYLADAGCISRIL